MPGGGKLGSVFAHSVLKCNTIYTTPATTDSSVKPSVGETMYTHLLKKLPSTCFVSDNWPWAKVT